MKSAYSTLGVPGNASQADIDEALARANAHYSRDRLGDDPSLVDKLAEIRDAHKLLSNPDMRAAHDRKLNASAGNAPAAPSRRPALVVEAVPPAWYTRPLVLMALAVVAMFAIGSYMSHTREQQRKEVAALELAKKKVEAEEAARVQAEENRREADRARADAIAKAQERQLRNESNYASSRALSNDRQVQQQMTYQAQNDQREAQRREQQTRNDERQRAYEAQRRVAQDQQRIRELCLQNYGKYNC